MPPCGKWRRSSCSIASKGYRECRANRRAAQSFTLAAMRRLAASNCSADLMTRRYSAWPTRLPGVAARYYRHAAGVVKLAYTRSLGVRARKSVGVRVPPPALFVSEMSTVDAFQKCAVWQDQLYEIDRSTCCVHRRGRIGAVGVRDCDLARRQPRGLCIRHRVLGSDRQRVPPDRGAAQELLARRLVGSDNRRLPPVLAAPPPP